jgi:DNA-binding protein HU-beta
MSKQDVINTVAERTGLTKVYVKSALESTLEVIKEVVASGEKVQFIGFGTFSSVERKARTGRNPQTGKPLEIAAKVVTKFKASF